MPDRKLLIPLNVRADIDTAMPISDRPPGTLVTATDCATKAWGPRRGSKAFTRVWEAPGTASLYDGITFTGGIGEGAFGRDFEDSFRDLGTKFTIDLWFGLESTAYASGDDEIGLYEFNAGGYGLIDVTIFGPNHVNHEKINTRITTSTRSGADTLVSFVSTTRISVGSGQINKHHIRLVRDGASAVLYLEGVQDGSTSGLSSTHGVVGALGYLAYYQISTSGAATASFKGGFYGAVLRDGAFTSQPIEAVMPINPMGKNVHHYVLGRRYALGGADHLFDAGPYGAHGRLSGTPTWSGTNDNSAPAPATVQGLATWTTRSNRTAGSVMAGGILSTNTI